RKVVPVYSCPKFDVEAVKEEGAVERPLASTPNLRTIPDRTDDHTAKSLPIVRTDIVLVTVVPAAMIVAMLVIVVVVVVVVIVILVFVFVFIAYLDQVGKGQRSKGRGLRYRQCHGCRSCSERQGG